MGKFNTVRGTHDLFGEDLLKVEFIEDTFKNFAKLSSFVEIRTPIFEYLDVFTKNIGNTTDIVTKEMYIFESKGGEFLALRPEGTASAVRAVISNGLLNKLPLKWFYIGPMFRYERPQKGRQRQFHQIGVEYLGSNNFVVDVECINLAVQFLQKLGIKNYKLLINSLGSPQTLTKYKAALVSYFNDNKNQLSEYSLHRLQNNPLRILDSKEENDKNLVVNAPKIQSYFSAEDNDFIANVYEGLKVLGINFVEDYSLVRGLDYYTHTVFEIVTDDIGAQGTLIAGGRYNNLIKDMGGIDSGSFGFAGGVERLSLMIDNSKTPNSKSVALISVDDKYDFQVLKLVQLLSQNNIKNNNILGKNIGVKLKKVNVQHNNYIVIVGDKEHYDNECKVKNVATQQQEVVKYDNLISYLASKVNI